MKFKAKYRKENTLLMIFILILILVTCLVWLMFQKYIYFTIFLALDLIMAHIYFFTSYYLKDKFFVTKLGFIKIKIPYYKIKSITTKDEGIKLNFKKLAVTIYPSNEEIFTAKLNTMLPNKN